MLTLACDDWRARRFFPLGQGKEVVKCVSGAREEKKRWGLDLEAESTLPVVKWWSMRAKSIRRAWLAG